MRGMPSPKAENFHLHLVSDATGETLNSIARAVCAQFEAHRPIEHIYSLVRSKRQIERVIEEIADAPGFVMYTLVNDELRTELSEACRRLDVPAIAVLEPIFSALAEYLNVDSIAKRAGSQHALDADYFRRIEAVNFTLAHDDGQLTETLDKADIILVGVSRTCKTPTCMYLANRGYKAANVPLVPGRPLPPELENVRKPLIVGLTVSPERLVLVRRNRLIALNDREDESDYADMEAVKDEILQARRYFVAKGWPVIDVTRRSIEETAAAIINLVPRHLSGEANGATAPGETAP